MRSEYVERWYRHPKTTAERRANQGREFVRGKRLPANLPNTYDDISLREKKSWKGKRYKQYRDEPRGEEHNIVLEGTCSWGATWATKRNLETYFKTHNIPYQIRKLTHKEVRKSYGWWKREIDYKLSHQIMQERKVKRLRNGPNKQETNYKLVEDWMWFYKNVWMPYKQPREYTVTHFRGYEVTWWSDKDIGVQYLLVENNYG